MSIEGDPETLGEAESAVSGIIAPAPTENNRCYTSGGTTWCEDMYTGKWCTGSTTLVVAWDYVPNACTWDGYATDSSYCYYGVCAYCWHGSSSSPSPWFYWLAHHHCS